METDVNPMDPTQRLRHARRCSARSKRSGKPCQAPAVHGWAVCRMHGAGGGAPSGKANGNWKDGRRSLETLAIRRFVADLAALTRSVD